MTTEPAPSPAALAILWDGYHSETFLRSIDQAVSFVASSPAETRRLVLESTGWLLDRALIELHSIDRRLAPGDIEIPWTGATADQLARLDSVYTDEAHGRLTWWFACWFRNTAAGDALAERHPPAPWTDDDD